jgi:hypothetical protein
LGPSDEAAFEWGPVQTIAKANALSSLTRDAVKEYESFTENLIRNHGKKTAVKVLKDLHSRCKLAAVGVISKDYLFGGIWIAPRPSTGLPKKLPSLSNLLAKGDWGNRIATSITSQVETMRLSPSTDITSITECSSADRNELTLWSQWCKDYSEQHWKPLFPTTTEEIRYHTSTSAGPNGGNAMVSAIYDSLIITSQPFWDQYQNWCSVLNRNDLIDKVQACSNSVTESLQNFRHFKKIYLKKTPLHLAKLLFLPDKAGKTRIVYCLTWWVQELLHPLHRGLYQVLYRIKQDGTKSHSEAASIVKQWSSSKRLWSVDLTNATDRFPKELQEAVIAGLLGTQQSKVWSEIMAIKPWSPPHNKYVEYMAGQPMGAKSSWAIFALTHHTILRLLCSSAGARDNPYVIIGDDVVIANDTVAKNYMELLDTFGVEYSKLKTIIPKDNGDHAAEFAKRIFLNGVERSPLTASLLDRVWKHRDYPVFLSVLEEIKLKWEEGYSFDKEFLRLSPPAINLFMTLPKAWKDLLAKSICKDTPLGTPNGVNPSVNISGYPEIPNPWAGIEELTYLTAYGNVVTDRIQQFVDLLTTIKKEYKPLQELPPKTTVGKVILNIDSNPIKLVINRLDEVLVRVYRAISEGDVNLQMIMDLGLDLRYLESLVRYGRSWESHKRLLERRCKATLSFYDDVYKACKSLADNSSYHDDDAWW